ncbi:MAG: type VI secretion system baseplate subunit TssF [Planctomycetota bacterium]
MSDRLLPYYQGELSYLRRFLDDFMAVQPDAAARLGIRRGSIEDPHAARLVEAFAYLTARIRAKLDDEFPELTDSFLNALYPHYLAPIPAAAVIQLVLDRSQGELTTGYKVGKGTGVEISDPGRIACRFRTCYDTVVWPIEIVSCQLQRRPFAAPNVERARDALTVLDVCIRCVSADVTFGNFAAMESLRFFLSGENHHAMPLYEILLNRCTQIAIATSPGDGAACTLSPEQLRPVGFHPSESLLPYDARSFPGYGLLTDYFVFPSKFLFLDLYGITQYPAAATARKLHIYFFLDRAAPELEPHITVDTLRLGCTPVVNLFSKRAEPIKVTQRVTEYPIIPDARMPDEIEVFSVDRVMTTGSGGDDKEFVPLYSCPQETNSSRRPTYWESHRRARLDRLGRPSSETEVFLSLIDLEFRPTDTADSTLVVETTCFNRDYPSEISRPRTRLLEGAPIREDIACLVGPTVTCRPNPRQRGAWALISHLLVGHLSIGDSLNAAFQADDRGAEALRRILELYDFRDDPAAQKRIAGVAAVKSQPVVRRLPIAPSGFARGIGITVDFDEEQFRDPGQGLYLFASVLESFFSMYCSMNSFSMMTARIKQGERILKQWPPNAGQRYLL